MRDFRFTAMLLVIIMVIFLSCYCESEQIAKNKEIVVQANDAINAQDYDKIRELYAENFVRHCQATPDTEIGDLETFIDIVKEWMTTTPDAKQTINFLAGEGDLVAFFVTFEGTQEGPMGPFPPTGKKMLSDCYGFHRIEDGKITETWVTWDNLSILMQLGYFPPPSQDKP